jgi:hypothetical protein
MRQSNNAVPLTIQNLLFHPSRRTLFLKFINIITCLFIIPTMTLWYRETLTVFPYPLDLKMLSLGPSAIECTLILGLWFSSQSETFSICSSTSSKRIILLIPTLEQSSNEILIIPLQPVRSLHRRNQLNSKFNYNLCLVLAQGLVSIFAHTMAIHIIGLTITGVTGNPLGFVIAAGAGGIYFTVLHSLLQHFVAYKLYEIIRKVITVKKRAEEKRRKVLKYISLSLWYHRI